MNKNKPVLRITYGQVYDSGFWMEFCAEMHKNDWYLAEGGDRDEYVYIPLDTKIARVLFDIFSTPKD